MIHVLECALGSSARVSGQLSGIGGAGQRSKFCCSRDKVLVPFSAMSASPRSITPTVLLSDSDHDDSVAPTHVDTEIFSQSSSASTHSSMPNLVSDSSSATMSLAMSALDVSTLLDRGPFIIVQRPRGG